MKREDAKVIGQSVRTHFESNLVVGLSSFEDMTNGLEIFEKLGAEIAKVTEGNLNHYLLTLRYEGGEDTYVVKTSFSSKGILKTKEIELRHLGI